MLTEKSNEKPKEKPKGKPKEKPKAKLKEKLKENFKEKHFPKSRSIQTGLIFNIPDKATKRVLAPYVNIIRKGTKATIRREKDNKYFTYYLHQKPAVFSTSLTKFLDENVELPLILHETTDALKNAIKANNVRLYLVDTSAGDIYISSKIIRQNKTRWKIQKEGSLASYVAYTKEYVIVEDILPDPRFPDGIPYSGSMAKSAICVPILTPECECYGVIELYRDIYHDAFNPSDLQIVLTVAGWMGASVYMNAQKMILNCEERLNKCLIELTKCYFADTVMLEKMITEIVSFAKQTVNAQRTTFFLIDTSSDDLTADVYDSITDEENLQEANRHLRSRLALDRGIPGYVARTGTMANVKDAFHDPNFEVEVEPVTGFITRSVLCVPVKGLDGVLGVIEAVNKIDGPCFTRLDENLFKTFSVYCGLALHYASTHQKCKKDEAKCEVVVGLLKRHMQPCEHELKWTLEHQTFYENPEAIKEFSWYISLDHMDHMPQIVIHMVLNMTGEEAMDVMGLTKFILTVRNFYRKIPYHCWEHGFNVCHCMYNLLLRNMDVFTAIEKKALMIATICHDIDHGGVTNNFLVLVNDVMAQLYVVSPWESHHYATMMMILSEMNIYNNISAEEFKSVSEVMRHAILSTDLAYYFKIRGNLVSILQDGTFDKNVTEHRNMMISVMMNVCDLSGQCKPWNVTRRITDLVLEEFYNQGDREKAMGNQPLSLMDRDQPEKIPYDQIMFLNALVMPCCDIVRKCLPNCGQMYDDAEKVKVRWIEEIALQSEKCWRQDLSVVQKYKKN